MAEAYPGFIRWRIGNALAYQVKLGATGPLTNQVSWFGEYRYQQAFSEVNLGSPSYPVEYASHSILGGIKLWERNLDELWK